MVTVSVWVRSDSPAALREGMRNWIYPHVGMRLSGSVRSVSAFVRGIAVSLVVREDVTYAPFVITSFGELADFHFVTLDIHVVDVKAYAGALRRVFVCHCVLSFVLELGAAVCVRVYHDQAPMAFRTSASLESIKEGKKTAMKKPRLPVACFPIQSVEQGPGSASYRWTDSAPEK